MRMGVLRPTMRVPSHFNWATYIWYPSVGWLEAWKMIQRMSGEKYASPARAKLWVSWTALLSESASLAVGWGLNSGGWQPAAARSVRAVSRRRAGVKTATLVVIGKL